VTDHTSPTISDALRALAGRNRSGGSGSSGVGGQSAGSLVADAEAQHGGARSDRDPAPVTEPEDDGRDVSAALRALARSGSAVLDTGRRPKAAAKAAAADLDPILDLDQGTRLPAAHIAPPVGSLSDAIRAIRYSRDRDG
jgi:hypothetical protein